MWVLSRVGLHTCRGASLLFPIVLLVTSLGVMSCKSPAEQPRRVKVSGKPVTRSPSGRLFVIGVDGVPPALVDEAIKRGEIPNFAGLAARGLMGVVNVRAAGMPPLSPRIWTTYVTGQLPEVHGLKGFVYPDREGNDLLYGALDRRVPAFWNIATELGRSVGVVNWWATSPAEAVNGFVISDLYADVAAARFAKKFKGRFHWDATQGILYPPDLQRMFVGLSPINRRIGFSVDRAELVDMNVFETAMLAMTAYPVDVALIYVRAFDELAHMAWHTHEPYPEEKAPLSDAILEYLMRLDWLMGRFLGQVVRPEDHVMVVSDHGFERDPDRNKKGGTHVSLKTTEALLILAGPRIRQGRLRRAVDVLDVMPTILELSGLPAADDMPGRVARGIFKQGHSVMLPRIKSFAMEQPAGGTGRETSGDSAMKERLRALGYIDDDQ